MYAVFFEPMHYQIFPFSQEQQGQNVPLRRVQCVHEKKSEELPQMPTHLGPLCTMLHLLKGLFEHLKLFLFVSP